MKKLPIILLAVVSLAVAGGFVQEDGAPQGGQYTAAALVEVLPYAQGDPFSIEPAEIDLQRQRAFETSMAVLMRQPHLFRQLLEREAVRETEWFASMGKDEQEAVAVLQQNFIASIRQDTSFLEVGMTCNEPNDALVIVDEMVQLFVAWRQSEQRRPIQSKISLVEARRSQIERQIAAANREMEDVRKRTGFSDLWEHRYRHPAEARLIRIEQRRDELVLGIDEMEAAIMSVHETDVEIRDAQEEIRMLQMQLRRAEELYASAVDKKEKLDRARAEFRQLDAERQRKRAMLAEMELVLEKLNMLHESPDVSRLRPVGNAWISGGP